MDVIDRKISLKSRLTERIVITIIISMLVILIGTCIGIHSMYTKKAVNETDYEVARANQYITDWLNLQVDRVLFISEELADRGYASDSEKCYEFLSQSAARYDDVYNYYIGYEDKSCVFADGWTPPEGFDITTRDWYKRAAASDEAIITAPYTDANTGSQVITVAKKVEVSGSMVGVIGADIFLEDISAYISEMTFDEKGYPYLLSGSGTVILHENTAYLPRVDSDGNDIVTVYSDTISNVTEYYSGDFVIPMTLDSVTDYDGVKRICASQTVEAAGWTIGYAFDRSEYHSEINQMLLILVVCIAVASAAIIAVVVYSFSKTFKPLETVADTIGRMAQCDLSVKFSYEYDDEIGTVCRTVEKTNATIRNYVEDISKHMTEMANGDFSRPVNIEYIGDFAPIKSSMNTIYSSLSKVILSIGDASNAVFSGASGLADGASSLAASVSEQTGLLNDIVGRMDEVSGNIRNNVELTDKAKTISVGTSEVVDASSEKMKKLLEAMHEISVSSEEIQKINDTVEDIAFQTNILALNASVEAARAGAAGKGFAVVADEVRNLAGKSAEASDNTRKLIEHSAEAVKAGLMYANETAQSLEDVVDRTGKIGDIIESITVSSHEQEKSVDEVNQKLAQVSDHISSSASNAEESAAASEELNGQSSALKDLISHFRA